MQRTITKTEIIDGPWFTKKSWTPFKRTIDLTHPAWKEARRKNIQRQKAGYKPMSIEMLIASAMWFEQFLSNPLHDNKPLESTEKET